MKRSYNLVSDEARRLLIEKITEQKMTIRAASKDLGIKYENAKAIFRTWRLQKRSTKMKNKRRRLLYVSESDIKASAVQTPDTPSVDLLKEPFSGYKLLTEAQYMRPLP
jgi:transposase